MKLRLLTLLFTMGLAACGSPDGLGPSQFGLIKSPVGISDKKISDIAMHIYATANISKNNLFVYVYPSWINRAVNTTRNIEFDNGSKLVLVVNDSQEHVLTRVYPYTYRANSVLVKPYYYGVNLPLEVVKDANFRLKLVRNSDSNTYDSVFRLPADISVKSYSNPLENGKLNLTRSYAQNDSIKLYWQAGITTNPDDRFFYLNKNDTCTVKENNQVIGRYKKMPDIYSYTSEEVRPLNINYNYSAYKISYGYNPTDKTYKNSYGTPNHGESTLREVIRYKKEAEKIDLSGERANNLSLHCEGVLSLYSKAYLSKSDIKNNKTDFNYEIKGNKNYYASSIGIIKIIQIPFFFDYKYTEKNEKVDRRDPETAHLMFIRQ